MEQVAAAPGLSPFYRSLYEYLVFCDLEGYFPLPHQIRRNVPEVDPEMLEHYMDVLRGKGLIEVGGTRIVFGSTRFQYEYLHAPLCAVDPRKVRVVRQTSRPPDLGMHPATTLLRWSAERMTCSRMGRQRVQGMRPMSILRSGPVVCGLSQILVLAELICRAAR